MKKLVHLGIVAILAITVSSCSKSTNDLLVTEQSKKEPASPKPGVSPASPDYYVPALTKIFPYINQPTLFKLGTPDRFLGTGEEAVFYVAIGPDFAGELPSNAVLITKNGDTDENIQEYTLISSDEASSYGIMVPYELVGLPFMFTIVKMDDQYTGKSITLHTEITVDAQTSVDQFDHAFGVILK